MTQTFFAAPLDPWASYHFQGAHKPTLDLAIEYAKANAKGPWAVTGRAGEILALSESLDAEQGWLIDRGEKVSHDYALDHGLV